jgi:hypothetical protein
MENLSALSVAENCCAGSQRTSASVYSGRCMAAENRFFSPIVLVLDRLIVIGQKGPPSEKTSARRGNRGRLLQNEIEDEDDDEGRARLKSLPRPPTGLSSARPH